MEDKLKPTLVGGFVLLLGAALVAAVLWLSVGVSSKARDLPYRVVMAESVAGLNLDAPVKFLGVDVGKVHSIGIDLQNSRQVLVGLHLHPDTPVKQDSEAVLKTQGLTGIAYVELSGGSPGSSPLLARSPGEVPTIRSKPSLGARLETILGNVLGSVDKLSSNLNAVFDTDNRAALKATLADLALLSSTLAEQRGAMAAGIADAALTARRSADASRQLKATLASVEAAGSAVQSLGQEGAQASQRATLAADAAASAVQQLQGSTLPEIDRLLADSRRLAASLQRLSEQTREQPNSLLIGGPRRPPGPGEKAPSP